MQTGVHAGIRNHIMRVQRRGNDDGFDVFEREPVVHPGLIGLENVVLTPHIGSNTHETRRAMADLALANLKAFFNKQPLLTPVPECQ